MQFKLIVGLFVALLLALGVIRYQEALNDAEELLVQRDAARRDLQASQDAFRELQAINQLQEMQLKEKFSYEDAIRKQLGGVHRKLNELLKSDQVAHEWHSTPLPDGIRAILQDGRVRDGGEAGVSASAGGADAPDPRSRNPPISD